MATQVFASEVIDIEDPSSRISYNDDSLYFDHINNEIEPYWLSQEPFLANADDSYKHLNLNGIQKKYRGGSVRDRYINEEMYALYGVDSTFDKYRLRPVDSISDAQNINANGTAHISFKQIGQFPSPDHISRYNDTRKLNTLSADVSVSGNNTKISYGKILYRTATHGSQYFGSWMVSDLDYHLADDSRTLTFDSGLHVQIVVLYEIRENALNIFVPHMYYRIRGIYRFSTY